ncbi:MAG: hypothetical protein QG669_263 [Patescibacteria group bacterium]|nr:hypothetical protein [Patescibacteria group bacterium]
MLEEEKKPVDRIEALKHKIYTTSNDVVRKTKEGVLHVKNNVKIPDTWAPRVQEHVATTTRVMSKPSLFKKFFLFSLIFFAGAVGFAVYKFYGGGNAVSSEKIEIEILGNSFTGGGEALPLQIAVTNKNSVPLELADMIVEYPKGSDDTVLERRRIEFGEISSGKTIAENVEVTLFGEQGSEKTIKAILEYRVRGSNAIFTKEYSHIVSINAAPLVLSVEAPADVSSNQEMTLRFKAVLNSQTPAENLMIKVNYPPGFVFKSATPSPSLSNNIWILGDIAKGGEKTVEIKGVVVAQDGEERAFQAFAGTQDSADEAKIGVTYNSLLHTVSVKRPFVETSIAVNGQKGDTVVIGSQGRVTAEVEWSNNLPSRVDNLEIKAKISGSAFNESSLSTLSGFYDSVQNEIIWDRNTNDDFASVSPGDRGRLAFNFTPQVLSGASGEPSITIEVSVKGTQPSEGNIVKEINNTEKIVVKISSSFQLAVKAVHTTGPFQNTGSLPPVAEQPTSYTVVWTATNSSNRINNGEVRATLPTYVKWVGSVSPTSEDVSYLPATREVVWKVGTIAQGAGFNTDPKEIAFQIELTPSLSQVGSAPVLVNDANAQGVDQFTGQTVKVTKSKVTTRINQDPGFVSGNEIVIR